MLANITFLYSHFVLNKTLSCGANGYRLGGQMKQKQSRQRIHQLRVPVLPAEIVEIKQNAADCGMSIAAYLRELGLKHKPKACNRG
jgi:hypothetical protein